MRKLITAMEILNDRYLKTYSIVNLLNTNCKDLTFKHSLQSEDQLCDLDNWKAINFNCFQAKIKCVIWINTLLQELQTGSTPVIKFWQKQLITVS